MANAIRIATAQCNPLMGDIAGNTQKIIDLAQQAKAEAADVVLFPELALCGYPPEDLLFRPAFQAQIETALARLLDVSKDALADCCVVIGLPYYQAGKIYNSAAAVYKGELAGLYFKHCLPNYGVFDEQRYFAAGTAPVVVDVNGVKLGLTVCEDIWHPGPSLQAKEAGAEILLNLNASPFHEAKLPERMAVVSKRVADTALPLVYCNLVGGQDELVFDGRSMVYNVNGEPAFVAPACEEHLAVHSFEKSADGYFVAADAELPAIDELAEVYDAIVLAVKDYVEKNGFPGVVLGLSGGIDSALVLAIAADALGPDRVEAVLMPSRYTADMSNEDAVKEAEVLGVKWHSIAIENAVDTFDALLAERFDGLPVDTTEENIQARVRGLLLMAISNKTGKMVLTTSNKSETAIGYATLYGDMAGGYGPLKDVFKTLVYQLAEYKNQAAGKEVIPNRVITRPPSAELRPDQKDTDSLPPYEVLDPILEFSIEADRSVDDIVALGYDEALIRRVKAMVKRNEYKRQQASPGVKITRRAFGRDRRYPITSGYQVGPK